MKFKVIKFLLLLPFFSNVYPASKVIILDSNSKNEKNELLAYIEMQGIRTVKTPNIFWEISSKSDFMNAYSTDELNKLFNSYFNDCNELISSAKNDEIIFIDFSIYSLVKLFVKQYELDHARYFLERLEELFKVRPDYIFYLNLMVAKGLDAFNYPTKLQKDLALAALWYCEGGISSSYYLKSYPGIIFTKLYEKLGNKDWAKTYQEILSNLKICFHDVPLEIAEMEKKDLF